MAFDLKKFKTADFTPREKDIPVPQLKEFFNGAKPVWKVRCLTGEELFSVREAGQKSRNIEEIIEKLVSGNTKTKVNAALEAIGISSELSEDYVRRLEMLHMGSVEPEIEKEDAVRLARVYPTLFSNLTDAIMLLTGEGQKLGESKASGTTRKSKTR